MVLVHNQNPSNSEPEPPPPLASLSNGDPLDCTETPRFSEDLDSSCSTPYVSAPSSPGRDPTVGYFYSAPASPMHFMLLSSAASAVAPHSSESSLMSSECDTASFEFSSRFSSSGSVIGSMSSADELFLNGKIRPMKLSSHLQKPQILAPLLDLDVEDEEIGNQNGEHLEKRESCRGRDLKLRSRSLHRKARSLSPLRSPDFQWREKDGNVDRGVGEGILESLQDYDERKAVSTETTPSCSASSSRSSSSSGRNSKKWIFLKDLLYRSKSEGRGNGKEKFWSSISFSPSKDRKLIPPSLNPLKENKPAASSAPNATESQKKKQKQKKIRQTSGKKVASGKPANGVAKRRVPPSAHELHYTANRAQAEEMKKRTYLPYRHGLFGCLGFTSKGYGALNGLARTLNPVSSR
ncbi:hypothetical protein SLE2022_242620 [Rubroshorea leprosula]